MRYLLDTNVCILGIAGREPDASFLRQAIESDRVALSVISIAEFLTKASKVERIALEKLAAHVPVYEIDQEMAVQAALYRKKYSRGTKRVTLLDCFIAAQAKKHGAVVATNNRKDYSMKDIKVIAPHQ